MTAPKHIKAAAAVTAAVFTLLSNSPAHATRKGVTGDMLLAECSTDASPGSRLWCYGYILGVSEMIVAKGAETTNVCPLGTAISAGVMTETTVRYIRGNPDRQDEKARVLILEALEQAFPCATDNAAKPLDQTDATGRNDQ